MSLSTKDIKMADNATDAGLPMVSRESQGMDLTNSDLSNSNDASVPVLLPVEILSNVVSFCPLSTLLAMRAANKQMRAFVSMECQERSKMLQSQRKKDSNDVAPSSPNINPWSADKNRTIEEALKKANSLFFVDDVLVADGYDEGKVKTALEKEGFAFEQTMEDGPGPAKFWRVETRWETITVAQAIREVRYFEDEDEHKQDMSSTVLLLMSAPSGAGARIAEIDVAIRKISGGGCQWIAFQQVIVEWTGGLCMIIFLPMRQISNG